MDSFWDRLRAAKARRILLDDYGLPGYWVEILPVSAQPPTAVEKLAKLPEQEAARAYMKLLVLDWNIPDEDGSVLPIPRKSDRWLELVPTDLMLFVVRRSMEIDQEVLQIPPQSAPLSSPHSEGMAAVRPGSPG